MHSALVKEILSQKAFLAPAPLAVDGVLVSEGRIGLHSLCQSCVGRQCLADLRFGVRVCDKGLDYITSVTSGLRLTAFGIVTSSESRSRFSRATSKSLNGRSFTIQNFAELHNSVASIIASIDRAKFLGAAGVLDSLHDIRKRVRDVLGVAEALVLGSQSETKLKDALSCSPHKGIYYAAKTLQNAVDQTQIYHNPESANFGRKRRHPLYKFVDRLVQILDASPSISSSVELSGQSWGEAEVFDSFELIPYALIENAAKYNLGDSPIQVSVREDGRLITLSVENDGPHIDLDELELIFSKGYRGRLADSIADGTGLGLYAAQIVAKAHDALIRADSTPTGREVAGIPISRVRMSISLRLAPASQT